jgi:predicted component of type VI protein secretion system
MIERLDMPGRGKGRIVNSGAERGMAVYLVPDDKGASITVDKAIIFIGRHPECDVVLNSSRKVSRRHCCFAQVNDKLVVRDLGSMNGIRVNGEPIKREKELKLGDQVSVGDVIYTVSARRDANGPRPAAPPAPPRAKPAKGKPPAKTVRDDYSSDIPVVIPESNGKTAPDSEVFDAIEILDDVDIIEDDDEDANSKLFKFD